MSKRTFDLLISLLAMVLFLPIFLLAAVGILIANGSPIIFKQTRVGRGGQIFTIHKFRTMYTRTGTQGPLITIKGDPRIFGLGRILRKWKIDELPQLYNVFTGDMSFVGPRPEVPKYVAMYTEEQRRVLELRPGITDVATLNFKNEEEMLAKTTDPERFYIDSCIPQKIALNLSYAKNAWIGSDIAVLIRTVLAVVKP